MKTFVIAASLFVLALAMGFLGYTAYTLNYAYAQQTVLLKRLRDAHLNAPMWRYGTIQTVDANNKNVYVTLGSGLSIQVRILDSSYIGRQDLIMEDGVYTGSIPPVPSTFADLQTGQRVAIIVQKDEQGRFIALMLLTGTPI